MGNLIKPLAVIATFGTAMFTMPSMAAGDVEIQTIEEDKMLVSYDVKDMATEEGRAEIERQIRRAADQICGPRNTREAGSFEQSRHNRDCFKAAVASAMETVNSNTGNVAAVTTDQLEKKSG